MKKYISYWVGAEKVVSMLFMGQTYIDVQSHKCLFQLVAHNNQPHSTTRELMADRELIDGCSWFVSCPVIYRNEDEGCIGTCIVGGEVCGGSYKCVPSIQSDSVTGTIGGGSSISQPSTMPGDDTLPQSDNTSSSDRTTSKRFYRVSTITFLAFALGCAL